MSRYVRPATIDGFGALSAGIDGVHLPDLPPFTTVLVRTVNSVYRLVLESQGSQVNVQGGAFFPDPTSAEIDGASIGGSCLRVGWIAVGLRVEIRCGGRRIVTSPVRAIATEQVSRPGRAGADRSPSSAARPTSTGHLQDPVDFRQARSSSQ